jgi:hypothetical protein
MSGAEIPVGVILDSLLLSTLAGMIFDKSKPTPTSVDYLKDPLLLIFYLYSCYLFIQVLNPNMYNIQGWIIYIRVFIRNGILIFIALRLLRTWPEIYTFFKYWLGMSTLAGVYACIQQAIGLFPFERSYIAKFPEKFNTVILQGRVRIFSFMADPAAFGILMACGVILCLVLLTASSQLVNFRKKALLLFMVIVQLLGLAFSGTRTAYVMLPMGLILFFLLNIQNRNTVITAIVCAFGMAVLLFGPFYGNPTIVRVRSAFVGSKDESMQVRDINRHSVQPYIHSHPIGGGLMTTGNSGSSLNPGHPLAGFQTDSGYLHAALELGWIGLIVVCLYMYMGFKYAVSNYFRCDKPFNKLLLTGMAAVLFSIIVAQYAQEAAGLVETSILVNVFMAISINVKYNLNNSKI